MTWKVSTITRQLWAVMFLAAIGGFFIAIEVGGLNEKQSMDDEGDRAVTELLEEPIALLGIALGLVAGYAGAWALGAQLEGGADWIGRRRPKPTLIHVDEVMRVDRVRGKVAQGTDQRVVEVAFTVHTADGRSIHVGEAGVHRKPTELMGIYERAFAGAMAKVGARLASGQSYDASSECRIFHDRIENPLRPPAIPLAAVAFVLVVIGTSTSVSAHDAAGVRLMTLPDDEMLLCSLRLLGVRIEHKRVSV